MVMKGKGSLGGYVEAVASPAPAPGGGSVAAVCGALSAALARMVAGIALNKDEYRGVRKELGRIVSKSESLQSRLLELAEEDSRAFGAVVRALSKPRSTPVQRQRREKAVQQALTWASEVPLETMEKCLEVLELSKAALEKGSKEAFTDAGSAAMLAHAAFRSAGLNVKVNLVSIEDAVFRRRIDARVKSLYRMAAKLSEQVEEEISSRF